MSVRIMAAIYAVKLGSAENITATARKAIALKLADWAHDDGTRIFPSVAMIAAQTEVSERTVQRALKSFVAENLLVVVRAGGKGGSGIKTTTEYRFNLEKINYLPPVVADSSDDTSRGDRLAPPDDRARGDSVTARGDSVTARGDTLTPKPLVTIKTRQQPRANDLDFESEVESDPGDPATGLSGNAIARGLKHAKGWDREELLEAFSLLPEAKHPDTAFVAWCRKKGAKAKKEGPTAKQLAKVLEKRPRTITPKHFAWTAWLDWTVKRDRTLAAKLLEAGAMVALDEYPTEASELPKQLKTSAAKGEAVMRAVAA